jgi:type IV pilus assembly protein PilX
MVKPMHATQPPTPRRTPRTAIAIAPRNRGNGAALVVGLILMLVITVLGVSGMNMASLELVMAGNTQSQQVAFQAAETGIDIPLGQGNYTTAAALDVGPVPAGDGGTAQSRTECMTTTPVPDRAFSMGTSTGTAQAFHFDIVSVGRGPRGATSTHNQSFYVVGPGGGIGC